jgi:hypothetical protein
MGMEFPLKTEVLENDPGWFEISDARGRSICRARGPFATHDIIIALQITHAIRDIYRTGEGVPIS